MYLFHKLALHKSLKGGYLFCVDSGLYTIGIDLVKANLHCLTSIILLYSMHSTVSTKDPRRQVGVVVNASGNQCNVIARGLQGVWY